MTVVFKGCLVAAVALVAGTWAERARADEAYICDGGRIVYVKPGQLTNLKQTDPCIAKYFEATPTVARSTKAAEAPTGAATNLAPDAKPQQVAATRKSEVKVDPKSDYRNVRIINAEPGSEGWFKHRW
jgi:hypothetical protein